MLQLPVAAGVHLRPSVIDDKNKKRTIRCRAQLPVEGQAPTCSGQGSCEVTRLAAAGAARTTSVLSGINWSSVIRRNGERTWRGAAKKESWAGSLAAIPTTRSTQQD